MEKIIHNPITQRWPQSVLARKPPCPSFLSLALASYPAAYPCDGPRWDPSVAGVWAPPPTSPPALIGSPACAGKRPGFVFGFSGLEGKWTGQHGIWPPFCLRGVSGPEEREMHTPVWVEFECGSFPVGTQATALLRQVKGREDVHSQQFLKLLFLVLAHGGRGAGPPAGIPPSWPSACRSESQFLQRSPLMLLWSSF